MIEISKLVLTNALVKINGVDISDHVASVDIDDGRDVVDVTSMGDGDHEIVLGLGSGTMTVNVFNDYAAASIDSQMWALHKGNTPFSVEIRPDNSARSTSNPAYLMTALMPGYKPIAGSVGAAVTTDLAFVNASQAGITRATS